MAKNKHPDNAAYVSADGLVSFDRYGRKIDSLGNVAWGDYQSAGDAGASPIQRKEEKREYQANPNVGATMTTGYNSGGRAVRRGWDKAPMAGASTATATEDLRPRLGNNPNVLAPGGLDPATGQPYPTARNGGVRPSAWRQPWMGQQVESGYEAPEQMMAEDLQVFIPQVGQQRPAWRPPNPNMPYPPTGDDRVRFAPQPGNGMMYDPYGGNYRGNPLSMFP
jgi:hypothetical protein